MQQYIFEFPKIKSDFFISNLNVMVLCCFGPERYDKRASPRSIGVNNCLLQSTPHKCSVLLSSRNEHCNTFFCTVVRINSANITISQNISALKTHTATLDEFVAMFYSPILIYFQIKAPWSHVAWPFIFSLPENKSHKEIVFLKENSRSGKFESAKRANAAE